MNQSKVIFLCHLNCVVLQRRILGKFICLSESYSGEYGDNIVSGCAKQTLDWMLASNKIPTSHTIFLRINDLVRTVFLSLTNKRNPKYVPHSQNFDFVSFFCTSTMVLNEATFLSDHVLLRYSGYSQNEARPSISHCITPQNGLSPNAPLLH